MGTISMNRNELLRELGIIYMRQQGNGGGYFMDGTYFYCIMKKSYTGDPTWLQLLAPERVSYGTYANDAKVNQELANQTVHIWGAEETARIYENNWDFVWNGTQHKTITQDSGAETANVIAAQDWTVEKEFKAVWGVGNCAFWIGGVLKATHVANVPSTDLQLFCEWGHEATPLADHTRGQIFKTGFYP